MRRLESALSAAAEKMTESGSDGQDQVAGQTSAQHTRRFAKSDNAQSWPMRCGTVIVGRATPRSTSSKQKTIVSIRQRQTRPYARVWFCCRLTFELVDELGVPERKGVLPYALIKRRLSERWSPTTPLMSHLKVSSTPEARNKSRNGYRVLVLSPLT